MALSILTLIDAVAGRGDRRFKSCHSDHQLAKFPTGAANDSAKHRGTSSERVRRMAAASLRDGDMVAEDSTGPAKGGVLDYVGAHTRDLIARAPCLRDSV